MPTIKTVTVAAEFEDDDCVMHTVTAVIAPPEPDVGAFHPSIDEVRCDTLPEGWNTELADDAIWRAYHEKLKSDYYDRADYLYQSWKEDRL